MAEYTVARYRDDDQRLCEAHDDGWLRARLRWGWIDRAWWRECLDAGIPYIGIVSRGTDVLARVRTLTSGRSLSTETLAGLSRLLRELPLRECGGWWIGPAAITVPRMSGAVVPGLVRTVYDGLGLEAP